MIAIQPSASATGRLPVKALRDFGRGSGHPAQLTLGDAHS